MARRTITLLAAVCATAAATACVHKPAPTPPPVKIAVPAQFNPDAPAWTTQDKLPGGSGTRTALSPDGNHYAYAYTTAGQIEWGQINLGTGEHVHNRPVRTLRPTTGDSTEGNVGLIYSGDRLILIQTGTVVASQRQWNATLVEVGKDTESETVTRALPDSSQVALPSALPGPLIAVNTGATKIYYAIDAAQAKVTEIRDPKETMTGCGGPACSVAVTPIAQAGSTTISTFRETPPPGRSVCAKSLTATSNGPGGFDGCLSGFRTDKWRSQDPDVAPKQAIAQSAHLYAVSEDYLIGVWRGQNGNAVYRTININDPGRAHAEFVCDKPAGGDATQPLRRSHSGRYLVAGSVLVDVQANKGHCFGNASDPVTFSAVDNKGTGWGALEAGWTPRAYAREAVRATVDGNAEVAGEHVGLPISFVDVQGIEVGAFAVTDDAKADSTVVAAYPRR